MDIFGWFIPTRGDTDDYGEPLKIAAGPEMFERVVVAAENAGFESLVRNTISTRGITIQSALLLSSGSISFCAWMASKPSKNPPTSAPQVTTNTRSASCANTDCRPGPPSWSDTTMTPLER